VLDLVRGHLVLEVFLVAVEEKFANDLAKGDVVGEGFGEVGFPLLKLTRKG
jgi:hypothetical protein